MSDNKIYAVNAQKNNVSAEKHDFRRPRSHFEALKIACFRSYLTLHRNAST